MMDAPQEERQDLTGLIEDAWSRWTGAAIDVVHMQPDDNVHEELKAFLRRHFMLIAEPFTPAPEQGLPKRPHPFVIAGGRQAGLKALPIGAGNIYMDALEARVRTLTEQLEGKWISVQERLPEEGQRVLFFSLYSRGEATTSLGRYRLNGHEKFPWRTDYGGGDGPSVTHWQPLPPSELEGKENE